MERSEIIYHIWKLFLPSIPGLYICGNWCEKLHTFWLKLRFFQIFSDFFRILKPMLPFDLCPLICGNWCEKLHTFWLKPMLPFDLCLLSYSNCCEKLHTFWQKLSEFFRILKPMPFNLRKLVWKVAYLSTKTLRIFHIFSELFQIFSDFFGK